jgi:ribosome-associated heat shock protein Hsp15
MNPPAEARIDKWLWAVRIYKTRTMATDACKAGHVRIGGMAVKPARSVHVGEIITAQTGAVKRTLKVLGLLEQRVGAPIAKGYVEDQTPLEEYERARESYVPVPAPTLFRSKNKGRPSKKDRRTWGQISESNQ